MEDNSQRASEESTVIDERPFVVEDGQALPFKDKSFEHVIASHVLEHVDDPYKFISELTRVGRAGYIESPSELGEEISGWPFHGWIVRFENNTIVLRRRGEDSPFSAFFHQVYQKDTVFAEFVDSHFEDFYTQYDWRGTINMRIEDNVDNAVRLNSATHKVETRSAFRNPEISATRGFPFPVLKLLRHFLNLE
jgi:ubiquinone/menaquinone biosynthesis C-methylase UbiE